MPTQNRYNPEVVQLEGGLDFVTPRPSVAPGALIDCYNYEVSDRLGYKRIDGIEPFDGRPSISNVYENLYTADLDFSASEYVGDPFNLYLTFNGTTECFATVSSLTIGSPNTAKLTANNTSAFYQVYIGNGVVTDGAGNVYTVSNIASIVTDTVNAPDINTYIGTYPVAEYGNLFDSVSPAVTALAEAGSTRYNPVIGAHLFNDKLYIINDLNSIVFDTGVSQVLPGDKLTNGTNVNLLVRDVHLSSGSWEGGDASGKISFSYLPLGTANVVENYVTIPDSTPLDAVRGTTVLTSAVNIRSTISTTPDTQYASLMVSSGASESSYYDLSSKQGWSEIDLGYIITFGSGTTNGPPNAPGRNASPTPAEVTPTLNPPSSGNSYEGTAPNPSNVNVGAPGAGGVVFGTPGGGQWGQASTGTNGHPEINLQVINDGKILETFNFNSTGSLSPVLVLDGFTFPDIPSDAIITGIEMVVNACTSSGGTAVQAVQATITVGGLPGSSKTSANITSTNTSATQQVIFGSSADLWGLSSQSLAPSALSDLTADLAFICTSTGTGTAGKLDSVYFIVYYQQSTTVYYFNNGTDDIQALITNTYIQSGDWTTSDAAGIMQVAQITPFGSAARAQIKNGDQIYTGPSATGLHIATVTTDMEFAGLPTQQEIRVKGSQYEIIDANFYGNADWAAIYGVSGAGPAFVWDGFYFRYIYTGLALNLENPRHVAFHNFHLLLGYDSGTLNSSATGSPEDFSGVDGAATFGTGDAITGLLRLNGTTMGIFCQKSIQALNGTDNTNFSISILSPYEGAIEYTVVDCGKPVYASYKGISTLDQTAAYGNFLGNRLSAGITPWIVPRLTNEPQQLTIGASSASSGAGSNGPLFALPIRNKNQYKLFFGDGYTLTLTFQGADSVPCFTIQRLGFFNGDNFRPLIPLAHSSAVDSLGRDRNHISYYDPALGKGSSLQSNNNYVWELDRGWGMGNSHILAWFTTTHQFYDNPFQIDNFRKIRLHGQSQGVATVDVAVSTDYKEASFPYGNTYGQTLNNAVPQDISLPRNGGANSPMTLSTDFQSMTSIANMASRGRSFSIQFASHPSTIEPPHTAQALLIQISENKGDI